MKQLMPSTYLLPIQATLTGVPDSTGRPLKCNLSLMPTDTVSMLPKKLQDKIEDVVGFGPGIRFEVRRVPGANLEELSSEALISELKCTNGVEFVLSGDVKLLSKAPLKCLTAKWSSEQKKLQDYFRCQTCSINWVCKTCAEGPCHEGHEKRLFMKAHQPSYPCCYCAKKKKCKIENSKSKKGS